MRGVRTTAISIASMSMLVGSAVGGMAQSDEADDASVSQGAAEVTGSSGHGIQYDSGRTELLEGKASMLGEAWEVTLGGMSDPRLDGTMRTAYNRDFYGMHGQVKSFATRIDNDHGSWLGTGQGYLGSSVGNWYFHALYAGDGAYAGLSALIFTLDVDGEYDYFGLVFPGELPEVPAMPEPYLE